MQNKGAIRLFAILLALACAYYLMFTWIAGGIQKNAEEYSNNYILQPSVIAAAKKSSAREADQKGYLDSVHASRKNLS